MDIYIYIWVLFSCPVGWCVGFFCFPLVSVLRNSVNCAREIPLTVWPFLKHFWQISELVDTWVLGLGSSSPSSSSFFPGMIITHTHTHTHTHTVAGGMSLVKLLARLKGIFRPIRLLSRSHLKFDVFSDIAGCHLTSASASAFIASTPLLFKLASLLINKPRRQAKLNLKRAANGTTNKINKRIYTSPSIYGLTHFKPMRKQIDHYDLKW